MPQTRGRPSVGWIVLLAVLLADAAILAWYWSRRAAETEPALAPEARRPPVDVPPPPEPSPAAAPSPGQAGWAPPSSLRRLATAGPGAPPAGPRSPGRGAGSDPAAASFWSLARSPKFRNSDVVKEWTRDFLAYPDLKEVNRRYWRDRDLSRFVLGTLRSPNFAKMLRRYAESQDLQALARQMLATPTIASAARVLLQDRSILAAAKDLTLPGLPSLGAMMAAGEGAARGAPGSPSDAVRRLKNDPNLRKYLERKGMPLEPEEHRGR